MTPDAILVWHDYFLCVATVGATLAGLLFIALTISLQHVLSGMGYLSRAFAALFLQFETLLVGLFGLVPGQPSWLLGAELIATGLAILAGIAVFASNFREDRTSVLGSTWPHRLRVALTVLPREQVAVVELSFFADKPHSAIAKELGLPLGTVKSRLRLAMARLRAALGDDR